MGKEGGSTPPPPSPWGSLANPKWLQSGSVTSFSHLGLVRSPQSYGPAHFVFFTFLFLFFYIFYCDTCYNIIGANLLPNGFRQNFGWKFGPRTICVFFLKQGDFGYFLNLVKLFATQLNHMPELIV